MKKIIKELTPKFLLNKYRDYKIKKNQGNNVLCPICNSTFKEFNEFGIIPRKNSRCYKCDSLERHRLLWKYFNEKTDLFKANKKIGLLHFAPEKSFYDIFSSNRNIEYFPCDLSPKKYKFNGNIKIKKIDITKIPFEENYFDVIICIDVLEHIPDDALAMSELYRVLKKEGWAILQAPIDYDRETTYEDFSITTRKGREKAFGQNDHVRWYGRDYKNRLKKAGFVVTEDDFAKSFLQEDLFKYGLIDSELIYYCKK